MTSAELAGLALALVVGLLIGAERGWQLRDEEAGSRVAGIRTFALVGLLGGLAGLQPFGGAVTVVLAGGTVVALLLGYRAEMVRDGHVSATSCIAAILTLGWGAAAGSGQLSLASAGAGATLLLLASRSALHRMIKLTSASDMQVLVRLALVVLVVLPVLPDAQMGPLGALNPRRLWLVVVTTLAISTLGYALARWLGNRRGTLVVSAVGALVSSTAVTLDAARRMRDGEEGYTLHAAIPISSAVMLARSLVLVALLAPAAFVAVAGAVGPALAVSVALAAVLLRRDGAAGPEGERRVVAPPGLGLALLFATSVAVLALATAWVEARWGDRNAALVIAAGGTFDIDAAIAAVGALPRGTLSAGVAALALALPTLLNTLFKLAVLVSVAGPRRALPSAAAFAAISLALAVPIGILIPPAIGTG